MENSSKKIGFGTAAIGRPLYINIKGESHAEEFSLEQFRKQGMAMLEQAYLGGVRYFDTAPGYGMAENLLSDWVKEKNDPTISIATKWGYTYVADFDPAAQVHEVKEHSLAKLNEQWEQSKNLLPYLKVYQIHSATLETGVLENTRILERLNDIKNEHGLLMGISTTGANQLEVLRKALAIEVDDVELFDVFQVTYNVCDQGLAKIATELHSRNKKMVIKEALANGRVFENSDYVHYKHIYDLLNALAKKYEVGTDAIALRFCIDSISADIVLSGASREGHLNDNLKAEGFKLDAEEIEGLKELAIDPIAYWNERKQLTWN